MAGKVVTPDSPTAFEYELYEGDPDNLRTVMATSNRSTLWIDPTTLKLRHRIGRGLFGDVYLATRHQSDNDYEQFHEVIVKMLPPVKEGHVRTVLDRFDDVFKKCQGMRGVCLLYGVSVIRGRVSLLTFSPQLFRHCLRMLLPQLICSEMHIVTVCRFALL